MKNPGTMAAPEIIRSLVARFADNLDAYRAGKYNETQLRRYAWSAKLPVSVLTDFEEIESWRDALVGAMLELHQQLQAAKTDQDRVRLERQVAATDREIDRLAYDLYGLTDAEIRIVEGR